MNGRVFADVIDRADVWVIERGCGARLTLKPFQRLPILRQFLGEKLQCNESAKPSVLGFVDETHPAAAKFADHSVMGNNLSDQSGRILLMKFHIVQGRQSSFGRD